MQRKTLKNAVIETVQINKIKECYIRPLVYIGYGAMGLYAPKNPINVSIAVWPWGAYLGDKGLKNGITGQDFILYHKPCEFKHVKR